MYLRDRASIPWFKPPDTSNGQNQGVSKPAAKNSIQISHIADEKITPAHRGCLWVC